MAKVELKNIEKIYDNGFHAVHSVSFDIEDKEFMVFVGPSGCGKTTTLRMVAGLEDISGGELKIDGKVVNSVAPKDRDIAMVFQSYALYPHMTVKDNMCFGLKLRKMPPDEIEKKVMEAAKMLDIEALLDRKPKQLSGGQRQRVAVGRAIVRKPKVFLFDEPLSNLDAKLRVQMRAQISSLHKRLAATMIYVTHDQTEAMTMGDRIVVMKGGFIQQIGTPMGLYTDPDNKFVAGFIGSPPMNFINLIVKDANKKEGDVALVSISDETTGGKSTVVVDAANSKILRPYVGKEVTLGIRPEDLVIVDESDTNSMIGMVDIVEPLGAETQLYVNVGKFQLTCRIFEHQEIQENIQVKIKPKMEKMVFFEMDGDNKRIR